MELRTSTIAYMQQHRVDFEPYLEDEEKFEHYTERMARVWFPLAATCNSVTASSRLVLGPKVS